MKKLYTILSLCLVVGMAGAADAQPATKDTHDEIEQTTKAATIFREIMGAPDKAITRRILDDADCIAVFPQVIRRPSASAAAEAAASSSAVMRTAGVRRHF